MWKRWQASRGPGRAAREGSRLHTCTSGYLEVSTNKKSKIKYLEVLVWWHGGTSLVAPHLVEVDEVVVVGLDYELGLGAPGHGPGQPQQVLVAEVPVGVEEVGLHHVLVGQCLLLHHPLLAGGGGGTQEEHHPVGVEVELEVEEEMEVEVKGTWRRTMVAWRLPRSP